MPSAFMGVKSAFEIKTILKRVAEVKVLGMSLDVLMLAAMAFGCNVHLLTGASCANLIFNYERVLSGEYHRLILHPFVHLSWYHLLLDAGAFMFLYAGLDAPRTLRKLFIIGGCGVFGLMVPLFCEPLIYSKGLCGLSGIAHGLMAFSALELIRGKRDATVGICCLGAVVGKSLVEAATGKVVFSFFHFSLCGTPIAACHLGGVIGGVFCYFIVDYIDFRKHSKFLKG